MLNGIGGRTIAEAQANMSYGEYLSWIRYANKTGPLRTGKHLGLTAAFIAQQFASAYLKRKDGASFKLSDFVFWNSEDDKEHTDDPEKVFTMFKALAASGNKDGK